MFKKLFKARNDAPPEDVGEASQPPRHEYGVNSHQRFVSYIPVDYDREGPGQPPTSESSIHPVIYPLSPPGTYMAGASGAPGAPPTESPAPVDYRASAPSSTPRRVLQPKVAANSSRLGQQPPLSSRYTYAGDVTPPLSPTQPQESSPRASAKFAYYTSTTETINGSQTPIELPASPVTLPYELPDSTVQRHTPIPSSPPYTTQSSNSNWHSRHESSTTLVSSPRSVLSSPTFGNTKADRISSPNRSEHDGIKKFVIDIYCPLKKDRNGNRREQIPRDVREFRLAKVALIPIVAGKRTFVSFDVVFGEIDKIYSDLVEKHFAFSHQTKLTELDQGMVNGGQIYTIGPMNIAYRDGDRSTVYVKFPSLDERNRFKAEFWDMWQYVEQTMD